MKIKFANLDFTPKDINEEQHTLRAVFSTGDVDRHGEIVDQKSWILNDFLKNPVVLFGHDHSQPPVGMITGLGYNNDGNLEGEVKFAAVEYPFANVIWNLYKGGFMKAFSVGFSAGKVDIVDDQVILKDNTLYEISTVAVPANAMALAKSKGFDVSALEEKMVEQQKCAECKTKEDTEITTETEETAEKKPEEVVAPVEEVKPVEETVVAEPVVEAAEVIAPVETPVVDADAEDEKTIKTLSGFIASVKEGRVLSKKNRKAIEEALIALQAVIDADAAASEEGKSAEAAEAFLKVAVPNVDMKSIKKLPTLSRNREINKAIRALLKQKSK
jgi:HK97 family phage prohead protease